MYVSRNICGRSRNHCCREKAISIEHYECVSVFLSYLSDMQSTLALLYCHLCPAWLYHIFPHYLTNGPNFGGKITESKMRLTFSTNFV